MLVKGIIKQLPVVGKTNKYVVSIPSFKTTGSTSTGSVLNSDLVEATLCYQPGIISEYNVGDVVYIGFENDVTSSPVILGKLYLTTSPSEVRSSLQVKSVSAQNDSVLKNVSINDYSKTDIQSLFQRVSNLEKKVGNN